MPVSTLPPATPEPATPHAKHTSWTTGRVLTVLTVLGLVIFWIWILSGAPSRDNPDRIDDRAYVTSMRHSCASALKAIGSLPPASDSRTAVDRAGVVDQATTILDQLVDHIEATAPHAGNDAVRFRGWIRDWRTYLGDRRDYARRLRANPMARLLLDVNKGGDSVDQAITNFADINDSPSCDAPGDVS